MRGIALQGSTGSIGVSTLEVIRENRDRFRVVSLIAGRNVELLAEQIEEFSPIAVCVEREEDAEKLERLVTAGRCRILWGKDGIKEATLLDGVDTVLAGASGTHCLEATLEATRRGMRIAIANKELLVTAGELFVREAGKSGALLIPVDSEHSAIFQATVGQHREGIKRIILTASGGPFHGRNDLALKDVSLEDALSHPVWRMGKKITIDSATMMNKGYEIIEAVNLFGLPPDRIDVVIHPQSIVHSMVEFRDGSILAHIGEPDMRIPISYALGYPERVDLRIEIDLFDALNGLEFFPPDYERFPSIPLAKEVARRGGLLPAVLVGANDYAVEEFIKGNIRFTDIYNVTEKVVRKMYSKENEPVTLEGVEETISEARTLTGKIVVEMKGRIEG